MKRLARLSRDRGFRREQCAFVVEGPTLVVDAVGSGCSVEAVFVDPGELERDDVTSVLHEATASGVPTFAIERGLRGHVDSATPNAVAAIVGQPPDPGWSLSGHGVVLVLVGVGDPGNLGTLLRIAEATAAECVVLTGSSADPWSPKAVRASAGAVFRVILTHRPDPDRALAQLAAEGYQRIGTRMDAIRSYETVDYSHAVALVLGSEAHGLPAELDAQLDAVVSLPMAGRVESLNVAMVGAVLCFEAFRQRRAAAVSS